MELDPLTRLTDEDLLAGVRAGRHEVFGTLVRRYERELYGYLKRYLGDADLASDVFQNTFVQVFVKIQQYEAGRPARPWLYTIATNQAIDALRRRARRIDAKADPILAGDDASDSSSRPLFEVLQSKDPGPVVRAETAEEQQLVRDAVEKLPELLRQVVILTYFQGLRYQDVADILEIPLGTVKSRLNAAVAKLTEDWGPSDKTRGRAGRTSEERK